jgi:uncharacterized protein
MAFMRRGCLALLIASTFLSAAPGRAAESVTNALDQLSVEFELTRHLLVPTSDGARLHGLSLRPRGGDRHGAVLIRTPYQIETEEIEERSAAIRAFLKRGFAVVVLNERGRYFSEGAYTVLPNPREDGVAAIEWIIAQPWSNGRVATFGCSSSAENQLPLAALNHPGHVAAVVQSGGLAIDSTNGTTERGQVWRGGVFQLNWLSWFANYGQTSWPRLQIPTQQPNAARYLESFQVAPRYNLVEDWPAIARGFPQWQAMERLAGPLTEFESWIKRDPADPTWAENLVDDRHDLRMPVLWMSSWFDYVPHMELDFYENQRKRRRTEGRPEPKFIVGPGTHCSYDSAPARLRVGDVEVRNASIDYANAAAEWLAAYLGDDSQARTAVEKWPAIRAHVLRADRFDAFTSWPPASAREKRWYLGAGRKLVVEPTSASEVVGVESDPEAPVPTLGGGGYPEDYGPNYPLGMIDQRAVERRRDVMVFTTEPFASDLQISGHIRVRLRVGVDAPDADVMAKLSVIDRNGVSMNLAETTLRLRYRDGILEAPRLLAPGEVVTVSLPKMAVAALIRRGERLRLQVAPSSWPQYTVNTQDGNPPETSTTPRKATISLYVGADSSHIALDAVDAP